ncbi:putative RNA ligase [Mimivirus AB-566-O17]|uniref:Putative RNA ligase n=1 Tax=Mimivirus AB-566-O17 TaxID=1988039 RepID=A0A1X9VNR1_9VIRU|nr:putative RNA ligase [Mimivirus AB-566-O17]
MSITELIKGKSFDEIKCLEEGNIRVRTLNATEVFKKLFLLVSKTMTSMFDRRVNGQIFEKGTNELVAESMEGVYEDQSLSDLNDFLSPSDLSDSAEPLYSEENEVYVEYAEDGTMIRLYNYLGEWYTATTRCIGGEYSYWSSREENFDKMFRSCLVGFDYSLLDSGMTYNFVLKHVNNRLVVSHSKNELVFVSSISRATSRESLACPKCLDSFVVRGVSVDTSELVFSDTEKFDEYDGSERYQSWYSSEFSVKLGDASRVWSESELEALLAQSFTSTKKGIIFMKRVGNKYRRYLYETSQYKKIKDLKGNTPNVLLSFLDLYTKGSESDTGMFFGVFGEYSDRFNEIMVGLDVLCDTIYNKYYDSHVKQRYRVSESDKHHRTLRQLHAVHKQSGRPIHLDTTRDLIYNLDSKIILRLLGMTLSKPKPKTILRRGEVLE